MSNSQHGFATRAIHAGQEPETTTGAVNVPIYLTSTYAQQEIGKNKGYEYSRVSNPTRTALEQNLAALEGGSSAHVFASGMAAISALVAMLKTGDHVICGSNVYGGTPRLFNQIVAHYGIQFTYVDTSDPENVRRAFTPRTRLVHIETPTNPLMQLTDIRAVSAVCREQAKRVGEPVDLCVDNTFMSPYFQRPIELGADLVMHSTTKFLNGHSDGLGGVLVATRPDHAERFAFIQKCTGGILSPFESYLILRGVKTLAVRMRQHDASGREVAAWLAKHPRVEKVFYPGLPASSPARAREAADVRFRCAHHIRDGFLGACERCAEARTRLHLGREPGRRGDADLAPGNHDPRRVRRGGPPQDRNHRRHGAHFRGHRGCRRPDRRSRASAGIEPRWECEH